MAKGNTWQHRVADSDEGRFGLLDKPTMVKYKKQPIFQEPEGSSKQAGLTAFGVTSGVGSMLIGAKALGFQVLGNVEWRDYYRYRSPALQRSTFIDNFPGAYIARGLRDVPRDLLPSSIDFAAGHPECGRYSALSYSVSKGSYQSSRGADVSDLPLFLKLTAELRPRFFLMDDLPASFGPLPMQRYIDLLPDYDLFPEWISNWGYGNIQKHRNRMFIVGALKTERFVFQPGEQEHNLVLRDAIEDLLPYQAGELPNHAFVDPNHIPGRYVNMRAYGDRPSWGQLQELFQDAQWSRNLPYYTPEGERKLRPGTNNPKWDGPCPVLSGGYNPLHPLRHIPLTVRERARIQGFPDEFIFYHDDKGPLHPQWEPYSPDGQRGVKQTGKAMPIQFCTYVADQVKHHIERTPFSTTGRRVLKPNEMVTRAKVDFCKLSGYSDQTRACQSCWHRESCELLKG